MSLWAITFGAAHDSSCVDDVDRTPSLLVGEDWRLGVGGRRAMSDRFDLAIAYELVWAGDMPVYLSGRPRAGDFVESYEGTAMHFLSASLRWKL